MGTVKVKRVELKVWFDVWEDELSINDVPEIVSAAVEKAGYSLNDITVVSVEDTEVEI